MAFWNKFGTKQNKASQKCEASFMGQIQTEYVVTLDMAKELCMGFKEL